MLWGFRPAGRWGACSWHLLGMLRSNRVSTLWVSDSIVERALCYGALCSLMSWSSCLCLLCCMRSGTLTLLSVFWDVVNCFNRHMKM